MTRSPCFPRFGSRFENRPTSVCQIGNDIRPMIQFISAEIVRCQAPIFSGDEHVIQVRFSNDGFYFSLEPIQLRLALRVRIIRVTPRVIVSGSSGRLTFVGYNFVPDLQCSVDGTYRIAVEYVNSTFVTCVTPSLRAGATMVVKLVLPEDAARHALYALHEEEFLIGTVDPPTFTGVNPTLRKHHGA